MNCFSREGFGWALAEYEKKHPDVGVDRRRVWAAYLSYEIGLDLKGIERYTKRKCS